MDLSINQKKFQIFFKVAKALNNKLDEVPVLYGSLGLYRIIGEQGQCSDVDLLVADEFTGLRWPELIELMESLGFQLQDEHEHEFVKQGESIAFGLASDLVNKADISPDKLNVSEVNGVRFKELSAENYLTVYQLMLRDNYRQEKRGKADTIKIEKIKEYLKNNSKVI